MKIVAWNCNMGWRKKAGFILASDPDIVIVPECECPAKLDFGSAKKPSSMIWQGNNPNKGLGIFSYSEYRFKLHRWHDPSFKTILPVKVSGGKKDFTLFAIWANNPDEPRFQYVGQIWKAINHYKKYLSGRSIILAGDFNSNSIWDKPKREGNHSTVVGFLKDRKIHSVYHYFHKQEQGKEAHPTLFLYRHQDKPYHLDYCFASQDFINVLENVEIGNYQDWKKYSDHKPLTVTFGI